MSIGCYMVQIQTSATESLFHEFEFRIQHKDISSDALEFFIKDLRKQDRYASSIDFLLCEFFPEEKTRCNHFYRTGKNPLREVITPEEKTTFETTLLLLLDLLEVLYIEERRVSWSAVKNALPRVVFQLDS